MRPGFFTQVLFYVAIVYLAVSCSTYENVVRPKNVSTIYNPSAVTFHPEYVVYHQEDSVSQLFFRIQPRELVFNDANPEKVVQAKFQIRYRLYSSFATGEIRDSSTLVYTIPKVGSEKFFISNIPVRAMAGQQYFLEILSTDLNRNAHHLYYLGVDKRTVYSAQNFLLRGIDQMPIFTPYLQPGDSFRIESLRNTCQQVTVERFPHSKQGPMPPYSLSKSRESALKADTVFEYSMGTDARSLPDLSGIYFFRCDTTREEGLTLYLFNEFYPETRTPQSLLLPLMYLNTAREFRNLETFSNPKAAVDSFWLSATGNMTRSKELIRVYYSRVYFANLYFSHFTEGWLSDRGMVYAVYGPPKTIYKSDNAERWIYGDDKNLMSMDFLFEKQPHRFTDNYYLLSRQEIYKSSWFQAIDTWRNGRVYSVVN